MVTFGDCTNDSVNFVLHFHRNWPLKIVPKVYFTGEKDVNAWVSQIQEYGSFNGIPDNNKYLRLKHLLTEDALLRLEKIREFYVHAFLKGVIICFAPVSWVNETFAFMKKADFPTF